MFEKNVYIAIKSLVAGTKRLIVDRSQSTAESKNLLKMNWRENGFTAGKQISDKPKFVVT